ncbi:cytochrome P450 [Meredithblackwellia eburnea MCA 4105]
MSSDFEKLGSNQTFVLFSIASGLVVVYLANFLWSYSKDNRAIGTTPRPDLHVPFQSKFLLGNLPAFQQGVDIIPEMWLEQMQNNKTGKTLSATLPWKRLISISNPAALEYVQHTNFKNYVKGQDAHDRLSVLGEGIFASDGEKWNIQRKATSKIFTTSAFRGIISTSIESHLITLRQRLDKYCSQGNAFDIQTVFFAFTLDSFAQLAMGQELGCLGSEKPIPFAVAFDYTQSVMSTRFVKPIWKITEKFSEEGREMRKQVKVLDEFTYGIIERREAQDREAKKQGEERKDLLGLFMDLRGEDNTKLNKTTLRDAILNLIIAGRDTTAQTLSWTFFHLLSHPEMIAKLREEVDGMAEITYDNFKSLVYANAIFLEAVRLHPAVPKNGWEALGPDHIPGGPLIEKGDMVIWSDWAMGRLKSLWGEDAGVFRPERWIDENDHLISESNYKLHGFNGGHRLCLGKGLATFEAITVMCNIIRDYDIAFADNFLQNIEMCKTEKTPMYGQSLTLPMKAPLMVTMSKRSFASS